MQKVRRPTLLKWNSTCRLEPLNISYEFEHLLKVFLHLVDYLYKTHLVIQDYLQRKDSITLFVYVLVKYVRTTDIYRN